MDQFQNGEWISFAAAGSRLEPKAPRDRPLSKAAFVGTRALGLFMVTASLACGVVGLVYWHRLSWLYRIILEVIPIAFFGSREDARQLFMTYGRYRQQWEEEARKKSQGPVSPRGEVDE